MRPVLLLFLTGALLGACNSGGGINWPEPIPLPQLQASDFNGGPIDNPYFPLPVGRIWTYEAMTEDGLETTVVEVTTDTKVILGVTCVVVHDTVSVEGEVVEDTYDWFAQDMDGNVWYMGEDSTEYENGVPVSTAGSWEAGVDGALPGIVMYASPPFGEAYRQEYYEGEAEDMALAVADDETVDVPWGVFTNCLHTRDYNPLSGELEDKWYAPGVGVVLETDEDDVRTELVDVQ